ncbi:MAG: alpha/beta hydrolase [Cryobacterium sp.]|nr:alpha/beta hydrolase [Oligoflexia bacterium]
MKTRARVSIKGGPQAESAPKRSRFRLGGKIGLPASVKNFIGPKPVIRYSHYTALKVFEKIGFRFEVRRLGESRLGLLRWPLRKVAAGKTARRLVMVPGFGDTPLAWLSVLAGLKPILKREVDEVVLVDYPGYSGFLHDEPAFHSMDELLRSFNEVLHTLKPTILMGHSLGGWLAADYAIQDGKGAGHLKELILIDPGGLVGTEQEKANYQSLFVRAVQDGSRDLLPHIFAKMPFWLQFFEEEFSGFLKAPEIREFIESFGDHHLLESRVGEIRAKTTVIWGERDTLTPATWMNQWMALLPASANAVGILIKGSGHSPQIEKPGILVALFTQIFLGRAPLDFQLFPFWKVVRPAAHLDDQRPAV